MFTVSMNSAVSYVRDVRSQKKRGNSETHVQNTHTRFDSVCKQGGSFKFFSSRHRRRCWCFFLSINLQKKKKEFCLSLIVFSNLIVFLRRSSH